MEMDTSNPEIVHMERDLRRHPIVIGVCTDTYVIYQSVLEKKTYESQISDS